jgi:hypothetical protein
MKKTIKLRRPHVDHLIGDHHLDDLALDSDAFDSATQAEEPAVDRQLDECMDEVADAA